MKSSLCRSPYCVTGNPHDLHVHACAMCLIVPARPLAVVGCTRGHHSKAGFGAAATHAEENLFAGLDVACGRHYHVPLAARVQGRHKVPPAPCSRSHPWLFMPFVQTTTAALRSAHTPRGCRAVVLAVVPDAIGCSGWRGGQAGALVTAVIQEIHNRH